MRVSSPFDLMTDPADPAWLEHEDEVGPSRHVLWLRPAAYVCLALAAGVVGMALLSGGSGSEGVASVATGSQIAAGTPVSHSAPGVGAAVDPSTLPVVGALPDSSTVSADFVEVPRVPRVFTAWSTTGTNVVGETAGLSPVLSAGLTALAAKLGKPLNVVSGRRTRSEQQALFAKYLQGTGNLAAVPGTSKHEFGLAADVYVDNVPLADVPGARALATASGLHFPVPGEAWHVEPVGA